MENLRPERSWLAEDREDAVAPGSRTVTPGEVDAEYVHFFNESLDLLCIAGLDGYFKRLNPAWTTCLGWSLEELASRPFAEFLHPDDRLATAAEVSKLSEGAKAILFENRYRHADGTHRWLRWNARPVPGRQRIYAIARDITRQKRLETEILETVDRERERLGRDLHDGLCQTLAGIAALSSTLARRLAPRDESDASAAAEVAGLLTEAITEARTLARGFLPLDVERLGLEGALEALAASVRYQFGVGCRLDCDAAPTGLAPAVQAELFRIAQEAVSNAVTHGRARRIEIAVDSVDGRGLMSVRDDGVGLTNGSYESGGTGMHTMGYRSRVIGGSLEVRALEQGTEVRCTFPLPEQAVGGK